MCGIVGVKSQRGVAVDSVIHGLETLEYRGYDSWGVACLAADNKLLIEKQVGSVCLRAKKLFPSAHMAIGHTRWATHGGVTITNAHPHADISKRFVVVHNGVIENWKELKATLPDTCVYLSDTDTEVIPHLLSQFNDSVPFIERLLSVGNRLVGSNSFVVLDTQTQELGAVSFGSPLLLGQSKTSGWVVSDVLAFGKDIITYYPLSLGQAAILRYSTWEIYPKVVSPWLPVPPSAKTYSAHLPGQMMLHELLEAPEVVRRSSQIDVSNVAKIITKASTVWLTGAGTAYHAALNGAFWLRKRGIAAYAFPASESDSWVSVMKSSDVFLLISQSGETRDTLSALHSAKERRVQTVALVNREHSTLTREVDFVLITPAGPEQAVLATKSLVAQITLLWRIIHNGQSVNFEAASLALTGMLTSKSFKSAVTRVATLYVAGTWTVVIGEGQGWMLALEASLKLKEGAYLPAEGMAGGELKHGTLALVEDGTICLALDVDVDHRASLLQHASEIRARGGVVVGISPLPNELFDHWIPTPEMEPLSLLSGLVAVQYLTYQVALQRGINPDRPRNLAKSVTVE